jgi:hypothetical protein
MALYLLIILKLTFYSFMLRRCSVIIFLLVVYVVPVKAQQVLPGVTVKNLGGQIIISWINNYKTPVSNISIQRSYDSLKNYTTIGSVLNPLNIENGYADVNAPYNKMYYRIFVSFEGGKYEFSETARPVKEVMVAAVDSTNIEADSVNPFLVRDNWIAKPSIKPEIKNNGIVTRPITPALETNTEIITYPSRRIYTNRDNTITITLANAETKKYTIKFFDENNNALFELNKVTESYLVIEKVNFKHAGWFYFEVYESGKLIERNRFYVPKDGKNGQGPSK